MSSRANDYELAFDLEYTIMISLNDVKVCNWIRKSLVNQQRKHFFSLSLLTDYYRIEFLFFSIADAILRTQSNDLYDILAL